MKIKNSIFLILLFCMISVTSCESEGLKVSPPGSETNPYLIPVDEAIQSLYDFMACDEISRADSEFPIIKEIHKIRSNVKSRGGEEPEFPSEILYVVNFNNQKGFAVLSADKRIESPILALGDEGNLLVSAFAYGGEDGTRPIFPDYPMIGPGFYYSPDKPNEQKMNPNTVTLYDEHEDDTLVGNFDAYYYYPTTDNNNYDYRDPSNRSLKDLYLINEQITASETVGRYCTLYAKKSIEKVSDRIEDYLAMYPDGTYVGNCKVVVETRWEDADDKPAVRPLLENYQKWHQQSPFNDKLKLFITKSNKTGNDTVFHAAAGCFPLAIAKLMAYYESDASVAHVDWVPLNDTKYGFNSPEGRLSAANLLAYINEGCKCWYYEEGTFTFPWNAISFMSKKANLKNGNTKWYRFNTVKNMLDQNAPILIIAVPNINITLSHAWLIDGYKARKRVTTTYTKYNDGSSTTTSNVKYFDMVHCDWGWRGEGNGYFVSGIFDFEYDQTLIDPGCETNLTTNYNNKLLIDYVKP